jgi:hypothetical protein
MLQTYRIETVMSERGVLTVKGLPFHRGEKVEVIILSSARQPAKTARYPLRGKLIRYDAPFDSVVEDDWAVL